MIQETHSRFEVREPEDVGAVRRAAGRLADALGASRADAGRVELVATEVASNLKRHANPKGFALLRAVPGVRGARAFVEVLGVDAGPGMAAAGAFAYQPGALFASRAPSHDIKREGLGVGMAAVGRIASEFEMFSRPQLGTVVLARVSVGEGAATGDPWRVGGLSVAIMPASGNGDGWAYRSEPGALTVALADGLGHGIEAKRATDAALAVFEGRASDDFVGFVREANTALRATRGAAVSVCRVVPREGRAYFMGVGNVEGRIVTEGRAVGLLGRPGTLGMTREPPSPHVTTHPWTPGASTLVLFTDGVRGAFDYGERPELMRHDPTVIAAAVYREQVRGRDDATVVVAREADASLRETGARIV